MQLNKDNIPGVEVIAAMSDDEANAVFFKLRWPATNGEPVCPRCSCTKVYRCVPSNTFRCKDCLHNFTLTSGTPFSNRKMKLKGYLVAISLFVRGANALQVSRETGLEYRTTYRLGGILKDMGVETGVGRRGKPIYLSCEHCGQEFLDKKGERTSAIRRGKQKHAFCSHECYGAHMTSLREDDCCKRCNRSRKELYKQWQSAGVTFCNGYCQPCYKLLLAYHGDGTLVDVHEATQTLRKEARNERS